MGVSRNNAMSYFRLAARKLSRRSSFSPSSLCALIRAGEFMPVSRPSHILRSSREATMLRPPRVTGIPDFAQRCTTATG